MRILRRSDIGKRYFPSLPGRVSGLLVFVFLFALIGSIGASVFLTPAAAEAQGFRKGLLNRHDPLVREAIDVQHRHMGSLMRTRDVVGTGVGIGPDGLPAIKVFTARHGVPGIPEWLESVPVQVEVTGMVVALGDCPAGYCGRPSPIGVSTGHPAITAGTIGARVKDQDGQDGNIYALSNNHVYANSNNAQIGDSALQPGPVDGGMDPADKIGELHDFQMIDFSGGPNTIDAAIVKILDPVDYYLSNSTLPDGYGTPSSETVEADVGLPVKKYGRTTGMTYGQVSEINVTVDVCYEPFWIFCLKSARFVNQIAISSPGTFSDGGDSGSLIVTDDAYNNPVGLLFAGSSTRTIANPIGPVLERFGVTIDGETGPLPEPPNPPTGLAAEAQSSSQIDLVWADESNDETEFRIERCTDSGCGDFSQIATVDADVTSYSDTGLSASTTYTYRVRAYNSGGPSDYSNTASAETDAAPALPPAPPSNLIATAVSISQINLTWEDNSGNETGFKIERCDGEGCSFAQIATLDPDVTGYSDTGLSASTTYTYRVRAYNSEGESHYAEASATTDAAPALPPDAPSDLTATAVSKRQIDLSWTYNSDNPNGFAIERCNDSRRDPNCTNFAQIATVGSDVRNYSDTRLRRLTTYRYRIRAYNDAGNSPYSDTASATTPRR